MLFSKITWTLPPPPKKRGGKCQWKIYFVAVIGRGYKYAIAFIFPITDRGAIFLFANGDKDVFEVAVFAESCRSWLIDNTVQQGKETMNFLKCVLSKNKYEDKEQ